MKKFYKIAIIFLIIISGTLGFIFSYYRHSDQAHVMTGPGNVQLIQTFHQPALFVQQLAGDPQAGRKIFKEFCTSCHSNHPLIDVNAPHIGDKKFWNNARKAGMPALLKITSTGFAAMPARGGCFECSDEQLREVIEYLSISSDEK